MATYRIVEIGDLSTPVNGNVYQTKASAIADANFYRAVEGKNVAVLKSEPVYTTQTVDEAVEEADTAARASAPQPLAEDSKFTS